MTITRINFEYPSNDNPANPVIAFANIMFDDEIMVNSIRLISKDDKIFISFPDRVIEATDKKPAKRFSYVHPVNAKVRADITKAIILAYNANNPTKMIPVPDDEY